jgi:hypothetical protein
MKAVACKHIKSEPIKDSCKKSQIILHLLYVLYRRYISSACDTALWNAMGALLLVLPLSNGKKGIVVLCQIKVVYPWCTAWKLAGRSLLIICGEFKSVYKFWVLTRPVPRRKTCRWLAQDITDHSWLAPHLPSDSHTSSHGLAHCTAARAQRTEGQGTRAVPSSFAAMSVLFNHLRILTATYRITKQEKFVCCSTLAIPYGKCLWFSGFHKLLIDPILRNIVSFR